MANIGSSDLVINLSLVNDCTSVVNFKLVHKEADVDNEEIVFKPIHSQLFDYKNFYGYENLKINIFYTAAALKPYLSVTYDKKVEDATPEDVEKTIRAKFKCEFEKNISEFKKMINEDQSFKPLGEKISEFEVPQDNDAGDNKHRKFEVYLASKATPAFSEYHSRIETFTLWFIPGANLIDADDALWKTFYIMEKHEGAAYSFVGFANIYEFYCYPEKIRPRISQVMILPPFHRSGLCARLLNIIQTHYANNPQCRSITYEEPSEQLTRVRWYVDASVCATMASFNPARMGSRCDVQMMDEAQKKLKLNLNEIRTVFEILRLKSIQDDPEEVNAVREALVRRITSSRRVSVRAPHAPLPTAEDFASFVQEEVTELMNEYRKVIKRMKEYPLPL